jgi:hypothetical protein
MAIGRTWACVPLSRHEAALSNVLQGPALAGLVGDQVAVRYRET